MSGEKTTTIIKINTLSRFTREGNQLQIGKPNVLTLYSKGKIDSKLGDKAQYVSAR